jgi:hypothetical protein
MDQSLAENLGRVVGNAINEVINRRHGTDAGLTVGDFITGLQRAGVGLNEPLSSIEYGLRTGNRCIEVSRDEADGVVIREGRW